MPSSPVEHAAAPVPSAALRRGTVHDRSPLGRLRHRQRLQPTAGTTCPPRLRWPPICQQHQQLYDAAPTRTVPLKLWRTVEPVRVSLTAAGIDQSRLDQSRGALQVCGVIYAIYCLRSHRIYIGQTIKPCFTRFMEHVRAAYRGGTEVFHVAIRRFGWQNFVCFPLELLPSALPLRSHKSRAARFRQLADAREQFWIERLHTWAPRGYNTMVRARARPSRHRRSNPMRRHVPTHVAVEPHLQCISERGRWFGSRDYARRLQFLFRCYDAGTLHRVVFATYRYRTIACMISYLKHVPQSVSAAAAKGVLEVLERASRLRPVFSSRTQQERRSFIRVEWTNALLQRIGLKSVLLLPSILAHLPDSFAEEMAELQIAKKLVAPIGRDILNFSPVARELPHVRSGEQCYCRTVFDSSFRPGGGCVRTGDVRIIDDAALRQLVTFGPRFREHAQENPLDAIHTGLTEYIAYQVRTRAVSSPGELLQWRDAVLEECERRLGPDQAELPRPVLRQPATARLLAQLKQRLVFVPVDKAANNIGIICKSEYVRVLRAELERADGAYVVAADTEASIYARHAAALGRWMGSARLPYLYGTPKFHKAGWRFIAGSSDCSTAKISKVLSSLLLLVMRTLRDKDNDHIRRTGIRRFFVVERFEEISLFLNRWRRVGGTRSIRSGDFATMYTAIPHALLIDAITVATEEAFGWAAHERDIDPASLRIEWAVESGRVATRWVRGAGAADRGADSCTFSAASILEYVSFLVSNTYVVNGAVIRRQRVGLPMGTNCAPTLANVFLYTYESRFIDRTMVANPHHAAQFHMTFRYIDDVLAIDNPHWQAAIDGKLIYPSELSLADTSPVSAAAPVHFLGMDIAADAGGDRFRLSVYDKRDDFPFPVRRYPQVSSLIPSTIPYGVFLGQLHRGYRICTSAEDFLLFAINVAARLVGNGCGHRRLAALFGSFMQRVATKFRLRRVALCKRFIRGTRELSVSPSL